MGIQEDRAHARMAVKHAREVMSKGAANIAQDMSQADSADVVNRVESSRHVMGQVATMLQGEEQIMAKLDILQQALSQGMKAGNCNEQASAAFYYLHRRKIAGAQLLKISMQPYRNDNHVFVAISGKDLDGTSCQDWKADEVVLCDPWVSEMATKCLNEGYTSGVYTPKDWGEYLEGARISKAYKHEVESKDLVE